MSISEIKRIAHAVELYLEQIFCNWHYKSIAAIVTSVFVDKFGGNLEVLQIYCAFTLLDLILGSVKAAVFGTWKPRYLNHFLIKVSVQLSLVCLLGWFARAVGLSTPLSISIANTILTLCLIAETQSIVRNMRLLGLPIPWWAQWIITGIRNKSTVAMAQMFGQPEMSKAYIQQLRVELEEAERNIKEPVHDRRA